MFTAIVEYKFKKDKLENGILIWKEEIIEITKKQPGFIRLEFFTKENTALAIGVWKDQSYAQKFMETGVFAKLLVNLNDYLESAPKPEIWNLRYCEKK